jgi:hypothetical protein
MILKKLIVVSCLFIFIWVSPLINYFLFYNFGRVVYEPMTWFLFLFPGNLIILNLLSHFKTITNFKNVYYKYYLFLNLRIFSLILIIFLIAPNQILPSNFKLPHQKNLLKNSLLRIDNLDVHKLDDSILILPSSILYDFVKIFPGKNIYTTNLLTNLRYESGFSNLYLSDFEFRNRSVIQKFVDGESEYSISKSHINSVNRLGNIYICVEESKILSQMKHDGFKLNNSIPILNFYCLYK